MVLLACALSLCACSRGEDPPGHSDTRGGIARTVGAKAPAVGHYAPAVAAMPGALDYLSAYAGRTAAESGLAGTRPLRERLMALLGADYERFVAALPAARLEHEGTAYYLAGRTATGVAALVMDTRTDCVYAVEQDAQGRREYLERSQKPALPTAVRGLLAALPPG